MTKKINQTSVK